MSVNISTYDYENVLDLYQANLDSSADISLTNLHKDLSEYKDTHFADMIVDAIKNENVINVCQE